MRKKRKNPHAVALGKKGGKIGGPARAASMTAQERSESARHAVKARWAKYRAIQASKNGSKTPRNGRKGGSR